MGNKIAVMGVSNNAIGFDFDAEVVYFFRKGWTAKTLKLVNIAIPFERITAIELVKPTTWEAGRIAVIVDGVRLLAEDMQFENNASDLSVGDSMYPLISSAVERLVAGCPWIQLVNGMLNVPKSKTQQEFATDVDYKTFSKCCDKGDVLQTKGASVGELLLILVVGLICIYLLFKFLM